MSPRPDGHDWRLVPIAVASWAGAWIATSGWRPEPGPLTALGVGLGLLVLAAARMRRAWTAATLATLTLTLLATWALDWHRHSSPVAELAADAAIATVEFQLAAEPQQRAGAVVGRGHLVWVEARERRVSAAVPVVLIGTGEAEADLLALTPGARYRAAVRLAAPEPTEAAAAVLRLREVRELVANPGPLDGAANAMRQGLREAVAHSPPAQAALVPSLVVGDTSGVDDAMRGQFQATGLTHLMAVSGANLTLMLAVVLAVVRGLGLRGWAVRMAAVGGVAGFILVCGQEPSVLRAAAMGLVALAATGIGTGRRSVRALALAIVALTWIDPWLARSAGFLLSVAACGGIVLLGPRLIEAMARWAPRWAAEALAIPLSAQLATQPIVTAISEQVSVVGVLTNVLAGPFVGPTTVLGLAAALLCWAPFLAAGPGWLAGWCAQPILWLAQGGSAVPTPAWTWDATPSGIAMVAVGSGALAIVAPIVLRRPAGGAALALTLVCASLIRPVALGWPGEWSIAFCDVGQGDATVLNAGGGSAVLVDAGPEPTPTLDCLDSLGVRAVALVVLTHYHADHTGGAASVIERYRPALVLVRAGPPPAWLEEQAAAAGAVLRPAQPGERIQVGEALWTAAAAWEPIAASVPEADGEGSPENDASVVSVAEVRGLRALLPGDVEPAGQSAALRSSALHRVPLLAHVLKLPHHGSARQEPRFFEASGASLAVVSAGRDNSYGHPARSALDLAREHGMALARTDEQGSLTLRLEGGRVVVRQDS